jgi:hypothetical protein
MPGARGEGLVAGRVAASVGEGWPLAGGWMGGVTAGWWLEGRDGCWLVAGGEGGTVGRVGERW